LGLRAAEQVAWEAMCVVPKIEAPKPEATSAGDVTRVPPDQALVDALNRLLAGFGMRPDARTEAMIEDWHRRALATWRQSPQSELADLAIAEAEVDLNRWFGLVLGAEVIGDQPPVRAGRAAYLLCGAGERWPECFLSADPLPEHVAKALRAAVPPATPPAQAGSMPEQALESWRLRDLLGALPRAGLRALLGRTITATS
jgi:hypothetical protein